MDSTMLNMLGMGVIMVIFPVLYLFAMGRSELAHISALRRHGNLLLISVLGTGIIAFAIKLLLIFTMLMFPEPTIGLVLDMNRNTPAVEQSPVIRRHHTGQQTADGRYVWQSLPEVEMPLKALVVLGRQLFNDKSLSYDRSLSCSSCHDLYQKGGADGRKTALGIAYQQGSRNTPTVWNSVYQQRLFWDGRTASLEEQAKGPFINPIEMGMPSLQLVVQRVQQQAVYQQSFDMLFGGEITIDNIVTAIAAYEQTLVTRDTPYDHFVRGDVNAMSPQQLRGMALFESTGCVLCHGGANFSAASRLGAGNPYRIFPAMDNPLVQKYQLNRDKGRAPEDAKQGVWRVPSLRNVALTAPYFHNGAVDDLEQAVRVMLSSQLGHKLDDPDYLNRNLKWSAAQQVFEQQASAPLRDEDIKDIVAFLHALSSPQLHSRLLVED